MSQITKRPLLTNIAITIASGDANAKDRTVTGINDIRIAKMLCKAMMVEG
jgi:hypothetical protein